MNNESLTRQLVELTWPPSAVSPQPVYYVAHPDGTFTVADPQPMRVVFGSPAPRPPCIVCGTPYEKHGSYPTCASHQYTDGNGAATVPIFVVNGGSEGPA